MGIRHLAPEKRYGCYTKSHPIKPNRHLPQEDREKPGKTMKQKKEKRGKDDTVNRMTCKVQLLFV